MNSRPEKREADSSAATTRQQAAAEFVRGDRVQGTPGTGTVVEPTNSAGNVGVYWDSHRLNVVEWPQARLLSLAAGASSTCPTCGLPPGGLGPDGEVWHENGICPGPLPGASSTGERPGFEDWRESAARIRYERACDEDSGRVAWHDTTESIRHLYRSEVREFLEGSAVDSARSASSTGEPTDWCPRCKASPARQELLPCVDDRCPMAVAASSTGVEREADEATIELVARAIYEQEGWSGLPSGDGIEWSEWGPMRKKPWLDTAHAVLVALAASSTDCRETGKREV